MTTKAKRRAAALSLLCAALSLLLASTSSPLYATNFWTDTNVYFTIGRGMLRGLAPYRDLFDHKGPLLYALFAVGALISRTSFFGVFLLEVASLAAALYIGWRTLTLYGDGPLSLLAIPVSALVTASCRAFTQGGSAEEFCLPALALALYSVLRRMREGTNNAHPLRLWAALGSSAGWVFAVKYTDCGLFLGLGLGLLAWEARVCGARAAARGVLACIAGFALIALPTALWLLCMGALPDCLRVYFIQNIFDYAGEPLTPTGHLYNALAYLRTQSAANPAVAAPALLGCALCAAFSKRQRGRAAEALCVPVSAGLLLLFCYWGEMAHPYYALVFAALSPLGLLPLARLRAGGRAAGAITLAATLALAPACYALCAATPLLSVAREDMAQTRFAEILAGDPDATLLDVTSLDQGFYLASGVEPQAYYFADNNLVTEEKTAAIAGYLKDGVARYVVTCYRDVGEGYELIAEATSPFDLNVPRTYKLYRRIEAAP